ncbi:MAG: cell division protein ZapA [Bacteroidales bacterium]|nr:cell division protein ZapA [Bacteroidales bacterium]
MGDDYIKIQIEIAQRKIEIVIKKEWERFYREAEKRINDSVQAFAKRFNYTDHQDLISKILVDYTVTLIDTEERLNEYEEDLIPKMENMKQLADQLDID